MNDGRWTAQSARGPREILERVKALEVDAPPGTVDEPAGMFRLRWNRGYVYTRAPVLVGRLRGTPGGSEVDLSFEGDAASFQDLAGWLFLGIWWAIVCFGMLPSPAVPGSQKLLAIAAGGVITAFTLGLQAWMARRAREDRQRLRRLAEELLR